MTSLIAAAGLGRSASFIPAAPAAWSATTIAFMSISPESRCGPFEANVLDGSMHMRMARFQLEAGSACHSQQPDSCRHADQDDHVECRSPLEGCEPRPQEALPIGCMQAQEHIAKH